MIRSIPMPEVLECNAEGCVYNSKYTCHARGITVGGADDHKCDTVMNGDSHVSRDELAGVGACHVDTCRHNIDLECQAQGIRIAAHGEEPRCDTFATG